MLGAIAGDIIGSIYERRNIKTKDFQLFTVTSEPTDDSILTIATAEVILTGGDYAQQYKTYYQRYPDAGYGGSFHDWGNSASLEPYNSWGNGSAMRVSPIGFAYDTLETVMVEAERSAAVTHNHPEGVKGAQATASAIFLARTGASKTEIRDHITNTFGYDLSFTLNEIRPIYLFDVSCQGSVPQAIVAFLESTDFEDAIRGAISIGGDSDTIACIAGGIAEAFYGAVPETIAEQTLMKLDNPLRQVVETFRQKFSR
jgi:ADP-ribosylglycohydrolase